jgi:hypothetical protein
MGSLEEIWESNWRKERERGMQMGWMKSREEEGFVTCDLTSRWVGSRSGVVAKGCRGPIVSDFHECPTVAWSSTAFWFATATAGGELVLARTVRERCL